ncbi:plectin-like, partial [Phasianus colchicus]|uniref:plectin-like n=1 Tax=Phasianus colchicus TaxID=9054 RepID=UPI00129E8CAA
MTAKEKLLLWAQRAVQHYPGLRCDNFSSCWRDGRLFNAIIHRHRPHLVDMGRVQQQSSLQNLEQAFSVAETELGVTRLLDPEDVAVAQPDEKSIITYVSSLYDALPRHGDRGDGTDELQLRWQQYYSAVTLLLQWMRHHTAMFLEQRLPGSHEEVEVGDGGRWGGRSEFGGAAWGGIALGGAACCVTDWGCCIGCTALGKTAVGGTAVGGHCAGGGCVQCDRLQCSAGLGGALQGQRVQCRGGVVQCSAVQCIESQCSAVHGWGSTVQERAVQCRDEWCSAAVQCRVGQYSIRGSSAVQGWGGAMQCREVQCSTGRCIAAHGWGSALQHREVQCMDGAVHCSAEVQCSTGGVHCSAGMGRCIAAQGAALQCMDGAVHCSTGSCIAVHRPHWLHPRRLERLQRIVTKLQTEAGLCEEQLNQADALLQAELRLHAAGKAAQRTAELQRDLEQADAMLRALFADVQALKDGRHPQGEQMYRRVYRLHERLVALRSEHALHATAAAATLRTRAEQEEAAALRYLQELQRWVEENLRRMETAEWGADAPGVEAQLEMQRGLHRDVRDFKAKIERARSDEVSAHSGRQRLQYVHYGAVGVQYVQCVAAVLQYVQLGAAGLLCGLQGCNMISVGDSAALLPPFPPQTLSQQRLRRLEELQAFVAAAAQELRWLSAREEEEIAFDWSDRNPAMAAKKDAYSALMRELEARERRIKELQSTAERLLRDEHPARSTVEAFQAALQTQWSWMLQLCCCIEAHLKENSAYFQFFADVAEAEEFLRRMEETMQKKFSCDRSTTATRLEDLLHDCAVSVPLQPPCSPPCSPLPP